MDLFKFILLKKLRKQYNEYYNSDIELISDHKIQRVVSDKKPKLDKFKFSRNYKEKK